MEFTLWNVFFLKSLFETYLSFCSYILPVILICLCGLWSFLLFLSYPVGTPSLPPVWETKNIPKHQGKPKRRRKGGTQKGWRCYQWTEEETNRLISTLSSPLVRHHDTMRFHPVFFPDPFCQASSGGEAAANFLWRGHILFRSLAILALLEIKVQKKSNFLLVKVTEKKKLSFPYHLKTDYHRYTLQKMVESAAGQHDSVVTLPFWSSKGRRMELGIHQQPSHPKDWKHSLLRHRMQLSWAFPSLSSKSSPSAVHDYSSLFIFHRIPNPSTYQVYPVHFHPLPPSLPAAQPQPSPAALPQPQPLPPQQTLSQDHPQSPLSENGRKNRTCVLSDSEDSSEEDLDSDRISLSGETSMVAQLSLRWRQLENVTKVHSSNDFEETKAGRPPGPVYSAWPASQQESGLAVTPDTTTNDRILPLSVGGPWLNTCQELSVPGCSAQQMSDDHINNLDMRMLGGFPSQVLEFPEISKPEDSSSHVLLKFNLTSSANLKSEVDSKPGGFMPLRSSSPCLHLDNMTISYSTSIPDCPLPGTSHVGQEGQGALSQSPSDIYPGLTEDIQTERDVRQTPPPNTHHMTGAKSQGPVPVVKVAPPKPPRKGRSRCLPKDQSVTISTDQGQIMEVPVVKVAPPKPPRKGRSRCLPKDQSVTISTDQGQIMENKSDPVSMIVSSAEEFNALQSNTSNILTNRKLEISQMIPVNENKGEITVSTESPPGKRSVLQNPKSSDSKEKLSHELQSEIENWECSQAQDQCKDMLLASNVHVEDSSVNMEQRQEPRGCQHILRWCQKKLFPCTKNTMSPEGLESEELSGVSPGLGTSQRGRKSISAEDSASDERLGSKSPETLPHKGQSPPQIPIRKRIMHFFPCLNPRRICKKCKHSPEKITPVSPGQTRSPSQSRAVFTETTKDQKRIAKSIQEKMRRQRERVIPCPPLPLPSPVKSGKAQRESQV